MSGFGRLPLALACVLLVAPAAWAQPTSPPTVYPPLNPAACVPTPERLLIIDLKSGWWAGDGSDLFRKLLARMVKDCVTIDIEYHYIQFIKADVIYPGITGVIGHTSFHPERPGFQNESPLDESTVPSRPWHEYSQVWMLSGGNHDPTAVQTTHPFFQKLVKGIVEPSGATPQVVPNVMLGTGLGHLDHGNDVLEALQLPRLFQTHNEFLVVPTAREGQVQVISRLQLGAALTVHSLFGGVESIADRMRLDSYDVDSDFLLAANNPLQVIGQNSQGEPVIGVRVTDSRRVAVDAGFSRFYALFIPTEEATYRYLHNIVSFLSRAPFRRLSDQ